MSEKQELNEFGSHNGHEYVDLGLPSGLLWATCNVGADSPEEYGDYFAWGEIEPKEIYDYDTYEFCINGNYQNYSKYIAIEKFYKESEIVLELEDDAANLNWGGNWRMPTLEEIKELREHCTWRWHKKKKGYIVQSKLNYNAIFFPAAGSHSACIEGDIYHEGCYYWSCSLYNYSSAWALGFDKYDNDMIILFPERMEGLPVRPVCHRQ